MSRSPSHDSTESVDGSTESVDGSTRHTTEVVDGSLDLQRSVDGFSKTVDGFSKTVDGPVDRIGACPRTLDSSVSANAECPDARFTNAECRPA